VPCPGYKEIKGKIIWNSTASLEVSGEGDSAVVIREKIEDKK
jgi:hypothetical protein